MKANLYRCHKDVFAEKMAGLNIPHIVGGGGGYNPEYGLGVDFVPNTKTGKPSDTIVNLNNYFHDMAHMVLCVLQGKIDKLGQPNFGMAFEVLTKPSKQLAITVYENETKVVGIQSILAEHFGFAFDRQRMYKKEASSFADFSIDTDRGLGYETVSLSEYLPIKTKRPTMFDNVEDDAIWHDKTLLDAWGVYCRRKERAVRTLIKAWIIKYENSYTLPEILDALAKAEIYFTRARS